jgi:hypothetical protein
MSVRFVEMRKSPRIEVNAHAKIVLITGGLRIKKTLDCEVINISEGGALILTSVPIAESEFYLETSNEMGGLHLCSVVRRESPNKVGVRFIQDRRLEAEAKAPPAGWRRGVAAS